LRLDDGGKVAQAFVGHFDNADIWLDRAKRVVFGSDACLGQGVEQGGLAHIGQADDSAFQAHDLLV